MKKNLLMTFVLAFFTLTSLIAQDRKITGKVTSAEDGSGLPGVTVSIKGTNKGTQTNVDGSYSVSVPSASTTLVFSFVGLNTQSVSVGNQSVINVALSTDSRQLSEVVVTGYSSIQKRTFSGATANISSKEVAKQPFGSFDQALQGAATGVSVMANGGQPGQQAVVRIRGNGSINGVNTPLFIMDGVEISAADFQTMNQGDFESIEVLKDAVSTGIYGSRGANGVFVITTKRGKAGQVQINYDYQLGQSTMPEDRLIVMNSEQKIKYELQRGNPYGWSKAESDSLSKVNFSWRDELFRTAKTEQHQISATGGNEASKFYASLAYMDQEGIVKTTGLKRYTVRANVDNTVKNFKFGLGIQGGFSDRTNTSEANTFLSSPLNAIRWSNPYEVAQLPDGSYNQSGGAGTGQLGSGQPNGAMELFLNYNFNKQIKGVATSYLEYHIPAVKGLFLRTNWGVDYTQNENAAFTDPRVSGGIARQGILSRTLDRNFRFTGTTSLNYNATFGKHEISAGVFGELIKNDFRSFGFTGYGFTNGFTNEAGITPGTATTPNYIPAVAGNGAQYGLMSAFATVNYGFDGKYFLNVVARRDGSSRFGLNNKWANFGSVGAVWLASEEAFIRDIAFISSLKFRASYGTTGNNGADLYPIPQFGRTSYAGVGAWSPSVPGNPSLTWEINSTANIGVDFSVLKNRINGTVEVYTRNTTDQFYNLPVDPSAGGFTSIQSNFGEVQNQGIEVSLNADIIKTGSFTWNIGGNISYNKNEIVALPQDNVIAGVTVLSKGSPINTLFLVPFAGVDPETGNALYTKLDGTKTQTFNVADKIKYGTSDAPLFGGLTTRLSYAGFDLSAQANFFLGREMYNNDLNNIINPTYYWDNMHISVLNEWTPTNKITDVPRPGNPYRAQTSRLIDDASFWRLRNVTLGYTFNANTLKKIKVRSARVFVQGQNLFTITKFRGFDPEATGTSLTGAQYPSLVQTTFGLSIGF
jgi:TonB-linked SusC/RagA family outer membrane protein